MDLILSRQQAVENICSDNDQATKDTVETVVELKTLFDRDYVEFVRDRKRWKSEFDLATNKAMSNFEKFEGLLNNCMSQNKVNTKALKMVVDTQMIA
jgi:hypothetical protein